MTDSKPIRFYSIEDFYADPGMAELLTEAGFVRTGITEAQVIVFNGGADIGTSIYGEEPIHSSIPHRPSERDKYEIDRFNEFKNPSVLKVGICRGAQLLNCLNGGTLWQDVNNHGQSHDMVVITTGETIRVTSTHHQMMRPHSSGQILAVADVATRKVADKANFPGIRHDDDHRDTEIVWYPATSTLCIQGHPEYVPNSQFADFSTDLIRHYQKEASLVAA